MGDEGAGERLRISSSVAAGDSTRRAAHQTVHHMPDQYIFTIRAFSEQVISENIAKFVRCRPSATADHSGDFGDTPSPGPLPRVNRPLAPPRPVKGSLA